jgi:hypothetical protein
VTCFIRRDPTQLCTLFIRSSRPGHEQCLELRLTEDPPVEQEFVQGKVGSTCGQGVPNLEVLNSDMAKHEIPCHVSSGVRHVPGTEGTLGFSGSCLASEMAQDMHPPFLEQDKTLGAIEEVEDTWIAVHWSLRGWNNECAALFLLQQRATADEACQSGVHGAQGCGLGRTP